MLSSEEIVDFIPRITPQWLAGFFDGEGCVCASKRSNNVFNIDVSIAQSGNPLLLVMISAKFKNTNFVSYKPRNSSKQTYVVRWVGRNVIEPLEFIKEHVIIKKVQVDAALEMAYILRSKLGNGIHNSRPCSESEIIERERLAKIICDAKKLP